MELCSTLVLKCSFVHEEWKCRGNNREVPLPLSHQWHQCYWHLMQMKSYLPEKVVCFGVLWQVVRAQISGKMLTSHPQGRILMRKDTFTRHPLSCPEHSQGLQSCTWGPRLDTLNGEFFAFLLSQPSGFLAQKAVRHSHTFCWSLSSSKLNVGSTSPKSW
jgi:hypothetical protein